MLAIGATAQAADCPRGTLTYALADASRNGERMLDCIASRVQKAQAKNTVYFVLRLTPTKDVESFYGILGSALQQDLADHAEHGSSSLTQVIGPDSPYYGAAQLAFKEMVEVGDAPVPALGALVETVTSSASWAFATRWPEKPVVRLIPMATAKTN
jgi:hypothetical protein